MCLLKKKEKSGHSIVIMSAAGQETHGRPVDPAFFTVLFLWGMVALVLVGAGLMKCYAYMHEPLTPALMDKQQEQRPAQRGASLY